VPEDEDMKRAAKEVAEQRQRRKEEKEKKRRLLAQERQARSGAEGPSSIRSDLSTESLGLVSPDSEDLGYLLGDESVEEGGEEVVQPRPKRARTRAGPSDVAGSSRSGGSDVVGSSRSGRKDWRYWLGSRSGSEEGQTQTTLVMMQAPAARQPEPDTRRVTRRRTVAR
jgi:hypothetical protein